MENFISWKSSKVQNADKTGFLVLYVNAYGEIRPLILDANTLDDAKDMIRIRGITCVFYIKKLSAIIRKEG